MAKGTVITPEIEAIIARVYRDHPKWKAPKVRHEVRTLLYSEKREGRLTVSDQEIKKWPSLSVVQKVLAKVRKQALQPSSEDQPWTIFTLDDYPIPLEALPRVLQEYHSGSIGDRGCFTIRHAKWVARLSVVEPPERFRSPEAFPIFYCLVATIEVLFELIDRPPDFDLVERMLAAAQARARAEREGRKQLADQLREAENQALAQLLAWFGGELIKAWLKDREQRNGSKRKKAKNDQG